MTQPVNQEPNRRSGRGTRSPLWMNDFVSLNIHEGPSLDKYISNKNVAPNYRSYLSKMLNITEP